MIKNYFLTAFRSLRRNKIYGLINVVGLSLGLACSMLIILYVKDEVSYDRFHHNLERLYRVVNKEVRPDGGVERHNSITGYLQGPRFKAGVPEIVHFVRFQQNYRDLKEGSDIKSQQLFETDSVFFQAFDFPFIAGDPKTALVQPNSIVISEDIAKEKFGSTDALGKTLLFRNEEKFEPYMVTGVTRRCPENSSIRFDIIAPLKVSASEEADNENWFNYFLNTFVVLAPDADRQLVETKINQVYEADAGEKFKEISERYGISERPEYYLQPFADIHLNTSLSGGNGLQGGSNPVFSYILSGIALFILIIACINFVNLTVARSVKRAKEIGVRKVVGGDRQQLIFQFLGESFVLCFIAFVLAVLLVTLLLPLFNQLSNKALSLTYLFDGWLVGGYLLLFLVTGLLAGFYPALVLSKYDPVQTLYSRFVLGGKNYLQKSLVVLQFTLASFLIMATMIIFSQFRYLTTRDLGYDARNLVAVEKQQMSRDEASRFKQALMKNPDIVDVTFKNGGYWSTIARINGDTQVDFAYETVDESYLPLLKIPVVKGRNFSTDLPTDSARSVLVNETFVKKAGWKDPIGQQVNFWHDNNRMYTVVGVVKDYHFEGMSRQISSQLFTMKQENSYGRAIIKVKEETKSSSLSHIGQVFKDLFPVTPYTYRFLDDENQKYYESEAKWKQIMLFAAVLTIFISCIGLFGLSVLTAEKRTKEIGIRKVLGATVGHIATSLSKDFLKLVLIALLIAVPVAWIAANQWLEHYPYRITLGWGVFLSAVVLVVLVASLTVSFQAIRGAMANPILSLRKE